MILTIYLLENLSPTLDLKSVFFKETNKDEKDLDEDHDDAQIEATILQDTSATGRLTSEFQILDIIGKGGFGEVLKVNPVIHCHEINKRLIANIKRAE